MVQEGSLSVVREIMGKFTRLTGLSSGKEPRRYLWTDAFAVCNFLGLHHRTGEERYKQLALRLVDRVHHVLGRHREDDPRTGWISGLDDKKGEKHPTKGGLRIGKELKERSPDEPLDRRLEWKRDGQYYHYLTNWMHALNRVSQATGELTYNRWAVELAKTAHAAFTYTSPYGGKKSMYWKMSIDLTRPLVSSMGQHDPLDGFITYNQLQAVASEDPDHADLKAEIADMASICEGKQWATQDPLGIGGLLCDAYKVAQLILKGHWSRTDLLSILLRSSQMGLEAYLKRNPTDLSAEKRLAFRELGLSLGLHAVEILREVIDEQPDLFGEEKDLYSKIKNLLHYVPLIQEIEGFWLEPTNRQTDNWTDHLDINMVMLATSLYPDGYLGL
ncbi:MAG: hypothetical protein ACOC6H_00250 [Thermoproteota archaeon]